MLLCAFMIALLTGAPVTAAQSLEVVAQPVARASAVPPGAQRVPMMTLRMTNVGDADADVRAVTLYRRGAGAAADIDGVYAMQGSQRLTPHAVIGRTGKVSLRLRPSLTVRPGETISVDVLADFSTSASPASEHSLLLRSAADIDAADAPVVVRTVADAVPTRTGGAAAASVSVEFLRLTEKVRYGQNRVVARLRLSAQASDDQLLRRIVLTNEGSADGQDIRDIVLETSRGDRIAGPSQLRERTGAKGTVDLVLQPPLYLGAGDSINLDVRASVLGSARRTIRFVVDEPSDVTVESASRRRAFPLR